MPSAGMKSELATSSLPSQGHRRGQNYYVPPAFLGIPNKGEGNQKWLPHPCLLRGPKKGGIPPQTLHSQGSPMPSAGTKPEGATSSMTSRGTEEGGIAT